MVALSSTPIWMYPSLTPGRSQGLGGNQAQAEALMASVAAAKRNAVKARIIREVFDAFLLLMGDGRHVGRYTIEFDCASLLDDSIIAETRKTDAEADAQIIENSFKLFAPDEPAEEEDEQAFAARLTPDQEEYLREKGVLADI